jgi:hypothetical protein
MAACDLRLTCSYCERFAMRADEPLIERAVMQSVVASVAQQEARVIDELARCLRQQHTGAALAHASLHHWALLSVPAVFKLAAIRQHVGGTCGAPLLLELLACTPRTAQLCERALRLSMLEQ